MTKGAKSFLFSLFTLLLLIGCLPVKISPTETLDQMVNASMADNQKKMEEFYTKKSIQMLSEYRKLAHELNVSESAQNPSAILFSQFKSLQPKVISEVIEDNKATLKVIYKNGQMAKLYFIKEKGKWKFDLAYEVEPSLKLLKDYREKRDSYLKGEVKPDLD